MRRVGIAARGALLVEEEAEEAAAAAAAVAGRRRGRLNLVVLFARGKGALKLLARGGAAEPGAPGAEGMEECGAGREAAGDKEGERG